MLTSKTKKDKKEKLLENTSYLHIADVEQEVVEIMPNTEMMQDVNSTCYSNNQFFKYEAFDYFVNATFRR